MKNAKIFLVGEKEETLTPMIEAAYPKEEELQALLEHYWDLLPGDQIEPENPRRWLFVARELGVPGGEDEGGRWSLDHLFLDQDGIPTFVECKRAADTRLRREVVAQMLDYAANGTEYWGMDRLRQAAAETASKRKEDLDGAIRAMLANEDATAVEDFWKKVESNLRSGIVRLIFVAEEAPRELRRLVEFLNQKMADVEVLIVEIKQYVGKGQKVLVPRVIGLTEASRPPIESPRKPINEEEFLAKVKPEEVEFFKTVLSKARARGHSLSWGKHSFAVRASLPEGGLGSFVYGWLHGSFDFYFAQLPLTEEVSRKLRKDLLAYGLFREGGESTLRADVSRETLPQLKAVYDFILDRLDEILKPS